jgi:His/Glu/Gln/Arg/opine family amino acid ABC transporter permease subunit
MLKWLPDLLGAAISTVGLTVLITVIGTVLAIPLALVRQGHSLAWSQAVGVYSWFIRVTPMLIFLYFLFYGLPAIGILLPPFQIYVICGGLFSAAKFTENFRGGLLAVPDGQWEAAKALGLSPWRVWGRIILPQAVPVVLPGYMSNITTALKGTSLASLVTIDELTGVGNAIISRTFRPLEILFVVTAIYLALNSLVTLIQRWAEERFRIHRLS